MKRPDHTFTITISPTWRIIGCAEKQDMEARGLFGFHQYSTCPNCQKINAGYEAWGENGHCQGYLPDAAAMRHYVGYKAKQQWRMKSGEMMGYRFRVGGALYYSGMKPV